MTSTKGKISLDSDARRMIWQAYQLVLQLTDEKAADGDTLDGDPESAARDSADEAPPQKGE